MTEARGVVVAVAPAAAALLLVAGCAAGMAANQRNPGVVEGGQFKPTRAPVTEYGPNPSLTCPDRGVNGLIDEQVASVAKPDGRLCAVADTLLGWEGSDTPPESVLTVISSDFGLPQTVRRLVLTQMDTAEPTAGGMFTQGAQPKDVADSLSAPIRTFASNAQVPRYGVMTQRVKKGVTKVAVAMLDETLEMQPFPRKLNAGQSATLSGTVQGKIVNPKVRYTDAVGKLEQPEATPGKAFRAEIKCGDKPGRILVQITGEQEGGGDVLLANFPIGCGTDLPVAAALPAAGGAKETTDAAAGAKLLADHINQDRTAAGLKPLQVDPELSKIAQSLSEDRAKGKGTTSEELQRRMKEADISAPVLLVSEAQTFGAESAYTRFSNSPQDRANAMNADMTHLGLGIAPGPVINDKPMIIVTELFMKQLPPPNAAEVKTNLYQAIERRRADARAGALEKDPQLEEIAQAYASEMAKDKGQVPKARVAEIEAPLYKSFATVNEIGGVKADPMEFAQEPAIVGDAKLVGVGVGIGSSPQFGKNSTYVVILVGKKHTPAKSVKTQGGAKKQPVKKK